MDPLIRIVCIIGGVIVLLFLAGIVALAFAMARAAGRDWWRNV